MKKKSLSAAFLTAVIASVVLVSTVHFGAAQSSAGFTGIIGSDTAWRQANSPYALVEPLDTTSLASTPSSSFFDGFESGNLSQWDGTVVTSNNQLDVQSSIVLSGKYALHSEVPAPCSVAGRAYAYKNVDNLSIGFLAGWVYFTGFADSSDLNRVLKLAGETEENSISCIGIEDVNGTFEWALHYREGAAENLHIVANGTSLPQFDTWYFIECGGYVSSSDGFADCWVNGALIDNATGLDNAPIGLIYQIHAGLELGATTTTKYTANLYLDNVTFSTSYIPFVPLSSASPTPTSTPTPTTTPTLTPAPTPTPTSTTSPNQTHSQSLPTAAIYGIVASVVVVAIVAVMIALRKRRKRKMN